MKLSDAIAEVIRLATAIREYWNAELPKRHPLYPVVSPGEDSGPPPPQESQLRRFLDDLSDEQIYQLILVMYLGRGDFGTDDLTKHYRMVKDRFPRRESAIAQMVGKAPLADYLTDGSAELHGSGIDIDQLAFEPVESGD